MRIIFEDVDSALIPELLALLDPSSARVDTAALPWTRSTASLLVNDLPSRSRLLVELLIARGGWVNAEDLRGAFDTLRGLTGPITKAIARGQRAGRLPKGLPTPVTTHYDPNNRAYQKAVAFEMPGETLAAFSGVG